MKEEDYACRHIDNIDSFALKVQKIYLQAVAEAIPLGLSVKYDPKKPFQFSDYPVLRERVSKIQANLTDGILRMISAGSKENVTSCTEERCPGA